MSQADDPDDFTKDPEYILWEDEIQKSLVPKLKGTDFNLTIVPDGKPDVKFAVELGLSIMLDKPIIALVPPGTKVPHGLVKVADELVEMDFEHPEKAQERIHAAIQRITGEE